MATLAFSPRYAAPEVLQAYEAKEKEVLVDTSIDIWALGVMAYEVRSIANASCRDLRHVCSCCHTGKMLRATRTISTAFQLISCAQCLKCYCRQSMYVCL